MNVDANRQTDGKTKSIEQKVTSKYFSHDPMDESLSDFQEAKKKHSGPKSSKAPIKKPRKPAKKPKGQRDIRTALKPKKNDLVAYTEKFDAVCKKAGVDVDTEELQLAIALSKSLQSESNNDECPPKISSQERIKKIRTTLQEYGFKVPEAKTATIKKTKRHRKDYKLIHKTDSEKAQIISDKYSQVLFTNIEELNNSEVILTTEVTDSALFNISTNITYKDIKSNDVYYIDNLVEKSSTNGCLLRDWSTIPGRPLSPKRTEDTAMNFSEIECSQEELDLILSGPLKRTKKILSLKKNEKENLQTDHGKTKEIDIQNENKVVPNIIIHEEKTNEAIKISHDFVAHRSCSPDIFDDEESVIEILSTSTSAREKNNVTMDLTECIGNFSVKIQHNNLTVSENNRNVTNRRSNDFMEITECVATSSQPIRVNKISSENFATDTAIKEINKDTLDLTQSSDSLDSLPEINFVTNENKDDTVILSANDYEGIITKQSPVSNKYNNSDVVYDLTQDDAPETDKTLDIRNEENHFSNNEDINGFKKNSIHFHKLIYDCKESNENNCRKTNEIEGKEGSLNSELDKSCKIKGIQILDDLEISANENLPQNCNLSKSLELSRTINEKYENSSCKSLTNQSILSDKTVNLPLEVNDCMKVSPQKEICPAEKHNLSKESQDGNDINEENNNSDVDLTQSSNTSIGKMEVELEGSIVQQSLVDEDNYNYGIKSRTPTKDNHKVNSFNDDNDNIDLTQSSNSIDEEREVFESNSFVAPKKCNNSDTSFLEENKHEESSRQTKHMEINDISTDYDEVISSKENHVKENIDLTQSPNSPKEEITEVFEKYNFDHSRDSSKNNDNTVIIPVEEYTCKEIGPRNHRLSGQKVDISIAYDDVCVVEANASNNTEKLKNTSQTHISGATNCTQSSQNSEVFEIIDNELDYSLQKSRRENFDLGGLSILDDVPRRLRTSNYLEILEKSLPMVEVKGNENDPKTVTPKKNKPKPALETPDNGYIIKYDNVTPMPNYAEMTSPERTKELEKYGLKPFKRKRAIQILTHIYNQTHPLIESIDDMPSPSKRLKKSTTPPQLPRKILMESPKNNLEILENLEDIYEVTNETPELREIDCPVEDWVFQKREKAKVHSCRVPLHVAFQNYVSCRRRLREAILRYEPIEIDVIHKQLVGYGHRYDPKDLLRFMDKKCITVKTNDNNARNKN